MQLASSELSDDDPSSVPMSLSPWSSLLGDATAGGRPTLLAGESA